MYPYPLSIHPSIYSFIHPSIQLFHQFIRSYLYPFLYPCIDLYIHPIHLSKYPLIPQSTNLYIHSFIYPTNTPIPPSIIIHPSLYLSIHLFIHPSILQDRLPDRCDITIYLKQECFSLYIYT